jgi:hypothetical protein
MIVAVNVIGSHICLMLIFPRVHFKNQMFAGATTVSIGGANPTSWSN